MASKKNNLFNEEDFKIDPIPEVVPAQPQPEQTPTPSEKKKGKSMPLYLTLEQRAYVRAAAERNNTTVNGYLKALLEKDMEDHPELKALSEKSISLG